MSGWSRFWPYMRPHALQLVSILALALLGAALTALQPWPLKIILDHVLASNPLPPWLDPIPFPASKAAQVLLLALGSVVVIAAAEAANVLRMYLQTGVGVHMTHQLGGDIFNHLQQLSLSYHGKRSLGDLIRRTAKDSSCVQDLVMGVLAPFVVSTAKLVLMILVMWQLEPTLTLIACVVIVPLAIAIRGFEQSLTTRAVAQEAAEGRVMTQVDRALGAIPVIQGYAQEAAEVNRFEAVADDALKAHLRLTGAQIGFTLSTGLVTAVATASLMVFGGFSTLNGALSLGSLVVFLWYLNSLYTPLETLALLSTGLYAARARAQRVIEVLNVDDAVPETENPAPIEAHDGVGRIKFESVTFGYEPDTPVVRDLTFEVNPGESLAFVGPTGSGKTTVTRLILRFQDPWKGAIRFHGTNLKDFRIADWRSQIAFVPQEPFILPLSIRENISYGSPSATMDEIVMAARAANCEEFIERLPNGYETILGEKGATLSGGERQRLSIARAFLRQTPILVLDEPTASLDAESEQAFVDALKRLMSGRMTFIVAHRLSTIQDVDKICFLENGAIVEWGSPSELRDKRGRYWHFHEAQRKAPD